MKQNISAKFLYVYVCVTGASVMALELAASRFLAPYFGTSMIVWANIIGLILLSLSLGYWLGGRLADRKPSGNILMTLSLLSGIWSSLLPLWGQIIFRYLSGGIMNTPVLTILLSFVSILLVFAPPVFLLAMVSPFALRLVAGPPEQTGKIAGNLYAFSTLGSIIGTFGTAFGTIPFLGTQETLYLWSASLLLISCIGLKSSRIGRLAWFSLALPLLLYLWLHGPLKQNGDVLWSKDTLYQFVQVIRNSDGTTALVYNEGGGVQSLHRPHDALNPNDYYDDYLLLPYLVNHPGKAVILGSAGGTIPHLLARYDKPFFPNLQLTGVEIDPAVIPLARKYFGFLPSDGKLVNADGRQFINHTNNRYDIIIVDAYTQQIYIPFHLATQEFFTQLKEHLQPSGVVALNVNAISPNSKLLVSMEKTVQSVFPYTYVIKARGQYNYILLGSQTKLSTSGFAQIPATNPIHAIAEEWPVSMRPLAHKETAAGTLLTDNHAPVELMTDSMIMKFITNTEGSN
ncbi:fused MFS/spermidine synthase [Fodinisporobacter ferrooxydans]|uniref:Fused MFS/spermidine synthase n=1 Tax=Fodinisporobacter ferrooxydans TaxID=2901836 RepID=A0ABY4CQ47_9BACL|nr:fused MFS/spermidine synthase [Alicyclobacillaceae bacterium MYW30-H2]